MPAWPLNAARPSVTDRVRPAPTGRAERQHWLRCDLRNDQRLWSEGNAQDTLLEDPDTGASEPGPHRVS